MRLGRNLIAGLGNSALTAIVGLAATPFYLHYLGIEAYGLIGFFLALQAMLSLLDMGLSPTINREVARATAEGDRAPVRRLLHTVAHLAWGLSILMALAVFLAAPWITAHWLRANSLDQATMVDALRLMGLAIACRWPAALYLGAVNGAQRMLVSSSLASAYAAVSAAGAIALLAWVEPSVIAFFAWQAVAALAYTLAMRLAAWRALGGRQGETVAFAEIRRVWKFSAGMGLIAVSAVVFMQVDKALLSTLLELDAFGRYALASLLASGIYVLVTPMFNVVYPRFSALVAAHDEARLAELYSLGTRLLATLVFPLAMVLGFFAQPLVSLWSRDPSLAAATAPILAVLMAGNALHAVMYFPYALQLAQGMPRIGATVSAVKILLLVPLMSVMTLAYGEMGAAFAWLSINVFYLFFGTWMTHRKLLRAEGPRWLLRDVGVPLALVLLVAALAVAAGAREAASGFASLAWGVGMIAVPMLASLALAPRLREAILSNFGLARAPEGRSDL